jgi:SagB-type dehydrogenase family enzyme
VSAIEPEPQTILPGVWVYGEEPVGEDDPAELFHEASRLYPNVADGWTVGASLLARSPELRASATRAVRRRTGLQAVRLAEPAPLRENIDGLVAARRSTRQYADTPLRLAELSALLRTSYGVTGALGRQPLRAVPSGGALYPLELYVAAQRVEHLERALYHYDPLRNVLELVRPFESDELEGLTPYDELLVPSAAVTMISGVFWRSRFKYGQRAYRFALLEAGHVAQSFLFATTALGLAACPVGGFYDRKVDAFLGIDGLYEASLYLLPVGANVP